MSEEFRIKIVPVGDLAMYEIMHALGIVPAGGRILETYRNASLRAMEFAVEHPDFPPVHPSISAPYDRMAYFTTERLPELFEAAAKRLREEKAERERRDAA